MKSYVAGLVLAGSLSASSSIGESPTAPKFAPPLSSPSVDMISDAKQEQIAKVLVGIMLRMERQLGNPDASSHEVGDLFLELVPAPYYGNIEKEKAAIEQLLLAMSEQEGRLLDGLDEAHKQRFYAGLLELGESFKSIGSSDFNRQAYEARTYDALLQIVTAVNAESLGHLREFLAKPKRKSGIMTTQYVYPPKTQVASFHMAADVSQGRTYAESGLEFYRSSFLAERLYLMYNPELIAMGKIDPKKEELRMTAITLVDRIISTMVKDPTQNNSLDHEQFKDRLFAARRSLYRDGEMGYVEAQRWGFEEQERRNKAKKKNV